MDATPDTPPPRRSRRDGRQLEHDMSTRQRIAVAGATGRVGRHVVDVLRERGHEPVPIARAVGVDVITAEGLDEAVRGADAIVDASTQPTPDEAAATAFFETATANLQAAAQRAGVRRIVVVSIIGCDRFRSGYPRAKARHEEAMLAGPVPVRVLRAAQFHEFVGELAGWGRRGDHVEVFRARTQLVAARSVAEALVDLAVADRDADGAGETIAEIAGPREENLAAMARLLLARRGESLRVDEVVDESDPDAALYDSEVMLPGPGATLAGPTFAAWLDAARAAA
jgi:uncharacterized protein YbjT (DUF2867 family)